MQVTLRSVDPVEWINSLQVLQASNLLFQSIPWHQVLEKAYNFKIDRYIAVDEHGELLGAIASSPVALPSEYKHISLPFSDYAGPIGINSHSAQATFEAWLQKIGNDPAIVRLCGESFPSENNGTIIRQGYVHRIDLKQNEESLRKNLSKGFRAAIAQAERLNVEVRFDQSVDAFMRFWDIHSRLRREKFGEIPQPRRFFTLIAEEFALKGYGGVVEAWYGGTCIAGIVYLIVGNRVFYKFSASLLDRLDLRPNNLLMWRSMLKFRVDGLHQYDLGLTGASNAYAGLRQYKLGTGADELPLRFVGFNQSATSSASLESWKNFIGSLTKTIAENVNIDTQSLDSLAEIIYPMLL